MADTVVETIVIKVDSDTSSADAGLRGIQQTISKFKNVANTASKGTQTIGSGFSSLNKTIRRGTQVFKKITDVAGSWFKESNDYVEALNLFNVAMGDCADSAMRYAKEVEALIGIDLKEWLSYQGAFFQMTTGYGIANEASETMSKNLTQLAYDLSSLWNTDVETAFQRLQSGMSGQIKGLKSWGINVSVAQLKQTALAYGIELSTSKMTEAQKATLRYITIMKQTSNVQGDLARTIVTPANALRILNTQWIQAKRAMGQVISVIAVKVIPWFQALVEVVKEAAQSLADVLGYKTPDITLPEVNPDSFEDTSDSLGEAAENAKKLKKHLLGVDELNVLGDKDKDKGDELGGGYAADFGIDLSQFDYDFLANIKLPDLEPMKKTIEKILDGAVKIGVAFASWKIATSVHNGLKFVSDYISRIKASGMGGTIAFNITVGGLAFLSDLEKFMDFFNDIKENGINFRNGAGLVSEGLGLLGDGLIILGNTKLGASLKIIQGIGEIVSSIADMSLEGVNFENVTNAIRGISNIGMALGLLSGNTTITGVSMTIQGITDCVNELSENWDAITKGDWSGVDKSTLVIGAIEAVAGIAIAFGIFNKIKGMVKTPAVTTTMTEVTTTTETLSTTTSTLTSKLSSLAKNLALGIVVIAEVAVAAGIIVASIWGLGLLLEQVGIAWQPVIDNGNTVATAMGIGTGIILAVGLVTGLLGTAGSALIAQLGIGIAMLALLGVSAGLFIGEIWAIGVLLEQVGIAWQPVLDNGNTIATAIGIGTGILVAIGVVSALLGVAAVASCGLLPLAIAAGTAMLLELGLAAALFIAEIIVIGKLLDELGVAWEPVLAQEDTIESAIKTGTEILVAIGVVTAALGVASVATVGLLPLAIGLGTALLVELSVAFVAFCDSLKNSATKLTSLATPLKNLNSILPGLKTDMSSFTNFMKDFAKAVVKFTATSAIAGIAATIDTVIDFFTTDPVDRMRREVEDQLGDFEDLIPALEKINPLIAKATRLVGTYKANMGSFESATGGRGGFLNSIVDGAKGVINGLIGFFEKMANGVIKCVNSIIRGLNKLSFTVPDWVPGIGGEKFGFNISTISEIKIPRLADGGFPPTGQMFIAREAGPEMVGTIGNKSAVVNNEQIIAGISEGVADANGEQNALLREQNNLLRKLLEKDSTVNAVIGTNDVISSINRKNRRDGKTVIPVGC